MNHITSLVMEELSAQASQAEQKYWIAMRTGNLDTIKKYRDRWDMEELSAQASQAEQKYWIAMRTGNLDTIKKYRDRWDEALTNLELANEEWKVKK